MKPNVFRRLLAEGKTPVGHMVVEFGTRGMPKILEAADVDFVVVDTEHSGFGTADLADMMAWFKATPIAPFVRIPKIDHHFVARTLDLGALGIMAPNVESADEARAVVDAAKYAPLGKRGVMIGGAHTDFQSVELREFLDYSNENTTINLPDREPARLGSPGRHSNHAGRRRALGGPFRSDPFHGHTWPIPPRPFPRGVEAGGGHRAQA